MQARTLDDRHVGSESRTGLSYRHSAEFLGESDEKPSRPADVAQSIRDFILDYFADEPRAALAQPLERVVDVVSSRPWPSGVRIMAISTH